uniref:Uncharacterized protein n=1 Tax=Acrobeloides nanus TaxID=290746 RepID=A0A914BZP0_9BILA
MGWCGFLFSFAYRFALACLTHFNWFNTFFIANCIYFTLWKSYDLLWFWMHFFLCACFPALRPENYLLVWLNLIITKRRRYPNKTYKEVYNILYNKRYTKSERELKKIETDEQKEDGDKIEEGAESIDEIGSADEDDLMKELSSENIKSEGVYPTLHGADNNRPMPSIDIDVGPKNTYQYKKESEVLLESGGANGTSQTKSPKKPNLKQRVIQKIPLPNAIKSRIPTGSTSDESDGISITPEPSIATGTDGKSWTGKLGKWIPNRFQRSVSNDPNAVDILAPNFSNTRDLKDEKLQKKREKQEKKALQNRVRQRRKEELRELARLERKRKNIAEAIDLLLTVLRLITSIAVLFGMIYKTMQPAEETGHQSIYDTLDISVLFWLVVEAFMYQLMTILIIYRHWKLLIRLGCLKFMFWLFLVGVLGGVCMFMPMHWIHKQLDRNLCVFHPNSPMAQYFDSSLSDRL